jgi:hypothetical protein
MATGVAQAGGGVNGLDDVGVVLEPANVAGNVPGAFQSLLIR